MNTFHKIIYLFFIPFVVISCGNDDDNSTSNETSTNANANIATSTNVVRRLEFPHLSKGNNIVLVHTTSEYGINYSVEWDCIKKSQRWTVYEMYNSNSVSNWKRSDWYDTEWNGDPFQEDPNLPVGYRTTLDMYRGSGYNRGHLCPSADRLENQEANEQTFYLSNMQPQKYNFNGKLWAVMEQQVRNWNKASFRDTLYVVKGGTIDKANQVLGYTASGLLIPKYFFMAILCKNTEGYKALAFWAEHIDEDHSSDALVNYAISIDKLESLTGIDFFCNLPDDIENKVEANTYPASWGLK
jgi:endonuclease G